MRITGVSGARPTMSLSARRRFIPGVASSRTTASKGNLPWGAAGRLTHPSGPTVTARNFTRVGRVKWRRAAFDLARMEHFKRREVLFPFRPAALHQTIQDQKQVLDEIGPFHYIVIRACLQHFDRRVLIGGPGQHDHCQRQILLADAHDHAQAFRSLDDRIQKQRVVTAGRGCACQSVVDSWATHRGGCAGRACPARVPGNLHD